MSCPRDTDGDGNCGQPLCPDCGGGRPNPWPAPTGRPVGAVSSETVKEAAAWLAREMTADPEVKIAVTGFMRRHGANTMAGAMKSHPLELVELYEALVLMCDESPLEETVATSAETVILRDK